MPDVYCNTISIHWNNSAPAAFDLTNSVHIWRVRVSSSAAQLHYFQSLLNEAEREKASSYKNEKDTQRSVISRGALRLLIAQYTGCQPADIKFETGDNKKPFIHTDGVPLHYNISHSGDWILIAMANRPVGIDIEKTDPSFAFTEILTSCLSAQEISCIKEAEKPQATFYLLWTRKEALVKANAGRIDDDFALIPCTDGLHKMASGIIDITGDWQVSSFKVEKGYTGSIAYDPAIQSISFWGAGNEMHFKD